MTTAEWTVTMIVPTYKRPELLTQCLRSLQAQTHRDFHVLVCDNGADAETAAVVADLRDSRFEYVPRRSNLGILGNVQAAFREVASPLVMELDDDDMLEPTCLERLVEPFADHPDLALAFCDLEVVDSVGVPVSDRVRATKIQESRRLRAGYYPDFNSMAIRGHVFMVGALIARDAVDWSTIPAGATTSYDRYLAMAAARTGRGACYVDQRLVRYRVHSSADSSRGFISQTAGALFVLGDALDRAPLSQRNSLTFEMANLRFDLARFLWRQRKWRQAAVAVVAAFTRPGGMTYAVHHVARTASAWLATTRPQGRGVELGPSPRL